MDRAQIHRQLSKKIIASAWCSVHPDKDIESSTKADWHGVVGYLADRLVDVAMALPVVDTSDIEFFEQGE